MYREQHTSHRFIITVDMLGDGSAWLVSTDVATGSVAWTLHLEDGRGTPRIVIDARYIFVLAGSVLFGVDYATGRALWKNKLPAVGIDTMLLLEDDRLFCLSHDTLTAFDAATGGRSWHQKSRGSNARAFGYPKNYAQVDED